MACEDIARHLADLRSEKKGLEPGGIETFLQREVLPHAPDAWHDPDSVRTGHEVSFTRYFYAPAPLRSLEAIRADILALEKETEGLLSEILGSSPASPVKASVSMRPGLAHVKT